MASGAGGLVKFLAVARITRSADVVEEKRPVIAHHMANPKDPAGKNYMKKTTKILAQTADRIQEGKRIKFTPEKKEVPYEVYLMAYQVPNNPNVMLAFFAFVDKTFLQAFQISTLYDELRTNFFQTCDATDILVAKPNGALHRKTQNMLQAVSTKYGSSQLAIASQKVNDVKIQMQDNIDRALENAAAVDDLERSADALDSTAGRYLQGAKKAERAACLALWKMRGMILLGVLIAIGILAAIICAATGCE